MNESKFLWHAKRGHGICIEVLSKNSTPYLKCVKKILLNNYSFLAENEFRSSYAYEMTMQYNEKTKFVDLILDKLFRLRLDDSYSICYLLDNLYFFSLTNEQELRIFMLLLKWLKKDFFIENEQKSINSFFDLIIDKKIIVEKTKSELKKYLLLYPCSNIKIHNFLLQPENYVIHKAKKLNPEEEINDEIVYKLENDDYFKKIYPIFSIYADNDIICNLITILKSDVLNKRLLKKIMILLCSLDNISEKYASYIMDFLFVIDKETDIEILSCISKQKREWVKKYYIRLYDTEYETWIIPIILNNYKKEDYKDLNVLFKKVKINYSNNSFWYECEQALIKYFHKSGIDKRLLKYVKRFFEQGLCTNSRIDLFEILLKNSKIELNEIKDCLYDANSEVRNLANKYLKKFH